MKTLDEEINERFELWNSVRNTILEVFPNLSFDKLNPLCLKLAKDIDNAFELGLKQEK